MPKVTELHVNGKTLGVDAGSERSLLSVLRDDLELTGAKYGCGEGQCGACTVLIDGTPTHSCLTQVGKVGQKKIITIEGLEQNGRLARAAQKPVKLVWTREEEFTWAYFRGSATHRKSKSYCSTAKICPPPARGKRPSSESRRQLAMPFAMPQVFVCARCQWRRKG